ncbi:MAG TPA: DUF1361 domain-containing protein [Candidatus Polarisedimenticolaceae bacterium]|nr:DUF1361 domain-containing protein [Candidatus Polarisedimenticolaceae bacterium]
MKYRFVLTCAAVICGIWLLRIALTGNLRYDFIVWNIFLASIPLLTMPVFTLINHRLKGYAAKIGRLITALVWLLFLPNAFYILTDFMHLNAQVSVNARHDTNKYFILYERGDGLYIYDTLLLFAATAFGAYVGGLALFYAYTYFRKKTSSTGTYMAMAAIMVLCAVGVYIGRFGRWNSWNGITQPHEVIADFFNNLVTAKTLGRFLILLIALLIFQLASLTLVYYQQKKRSPT